MLALTPQMRLLLAVEPADFRKGIDSLVSLCQIQLRQDPFMGAVFAFRNKGKTSVKLLVYDGTGFWLCLKRFSKGRLKWWPSSSVLLKKISSTELQVLLQQGDPSLVGSSVWRPIKQA